jgi:methylglutaconyl-CoA hydratase
MSDLVSDAVILDVAGAIATLTMDRPDNRNALTPDLLDGLGDGLAAAVSDPLVRVVVLTNAGPAFCAGADLKSGAGLAPARYDLPSVLTAIQDSPKPVVARIAGHCMGGGVGLAAACDLSIAAEDVKFGFTEVRIGAAPAIISVVCLPKMRRGDALELFLTGERIGAARAAEMGLITAVVPQDGLDAAIGSLVTKLLAGGPNALAAAKRLIFEVPGIERTEAFSWTAELSRSLFASAEAAEGMASFREKRPPSWAAPES